MTFTPIHKHLLVKTYVRSPIVDEEEGKKMLRDMVTAIGMKAVTEPQCVYVEDDGNEGLTGSINLATSHIAFHIWDRTGLMMLDVYSCKEFDETIIKQMVFELMGLRSYASIIIDRELGI